jgi:hypothetical protein
VLSCVICTIRNYPNGDLRPEVLALANTTNKLMGRFGLHFVIRFIRRCEAAP